MSNVQPISIQGTEQLAAWAKEFPEIARGEIKFATNAVMAEAQKDMREAIRDANAESSGALLNSVTAKINELSDVTMNFFGEITFKSPADSYSDNADKGRRAGNFPPLNEIRAWVSREGLDERLVYPIARSIALRGTNIGNWSKYNRRYFMEDATQRINKTADKHYSRLAEKIQKRIDANVSNSSRST